MKSRYIESVLNVEGATVRGHIRTLRRAGATIAEGPRGYKLTANINLLTRTVVDFDLRIASMTTTKEALMETIRILKRAQKVSGKRKKRR